MLSQKTQKIPHGTVRHEVLALTGEHTVFIAIEPPGGTKYWLQLSGFIPSVVRGFTQATGNVYAPTIRSGRTYADISNRRQYRKMYSNIHPHQPQNHATTARAGAATTEIDLVSAPFTDVCDVCALALSSSNDSVSTCSICHLSVHHSCYGLAYGAKGSNAKGPDQWTCTSCSASNDAHSSDAATPPECVFCTQTIGMMKKTTNGKDWAHLLCAFYLPNVAFQDIYTTSVIGSIDEYGVRGSIDVLLDQMHFNQGTREKKEKEKEKEKDKEKDTDKDKDKEKAKEKEKDEEKEKDKEKEKEKDDEKDKEEDKEEDEDEDEEEEDEEYEEE